MSTMKAAVFNRKNKSEQFSIQQVEKPTPKGDQVLVKVKASSINAADYRSVQFHIVPKSGILGADVTGTVEAVGEKVKQFKPGDEVLADLGSFGMGGFAEYVAAPEKAFVKQPEALSTASAASLPLAGITALQALQKIRKVQAGQKVLIAGSGGGVGTMAVQLARHFGAKVHAVCGPNNVEQSREIGAVQVFDYTKEDFTQSGHHYDMILAINGSKRLSAYKKLLKPDGLYVMVGGNLSQIFGSLLFGGLHSLGTKKMRTLSAKANQNDVALVAQLASEGKIKAVIERSYPLEEINEAFGYVSKGHARGKVVITVGV